MALLPNPVGGRGAEAPSIISYDIAERLELKVSDFSTNSLRTLWLTKIVGLVQVTREDHVTLRFVNWSRATKGGSLTYAR